MSKKIGVRSGDLVRSFGRNDDNSLFKIIESDGQIKVVIGSNLVYADKLNRGGFIRAKKQSKTKSGKPIYNMTKMFWARYYQSQNKFFKIMALSLTKKTASGGRVGVKIPRTLYFDKSVAYFNKQIMPEQARKVMEDISKVAITEDFNKLNDKFKDRVKVLAKRVPDLFQIALGQYSVDRGKGLNDSNVTWVN